MGNHKILIRRVTDSCRESVRDGAGAAAIGAVVGLARAVRGRITDRSGVKSDTLTAKRPDAMSLELRR